MAKLKYIRTRLGFAIFSAIDEHKEVAKGLHEDPVSAGFCYIQNGKDGQPTVECFGESTSLNLKSQPEDGEIITQKINSYY